MITQREISHVAHREQMSDRVIEKDYVLTWLLLALAGSPLCDNLVFKGGTSLKKIYFPDYRYSEDLDFTVVGAIDSDEILEILAETLRDLADSRGFRFDVPLDRIERRTDSLTALVSFTGPLQARLGSREVKIDFTLTERLVFPIVDRPVISVYSDRIDRSIGAYSLEEVVVEKLCAAIGRTEPRDI
jgi:predicted nucleotidyltransferase component of viral defense system